ncbi:hypothetical protein FCM35_KLT22307 [Carex littledalei]|uniref:START domain-containing protein n=1 Tax=Carex littledalei TaxID=544730 RepID=A0A833Q9F3_9POAL|nr:hypothetical protein FCM35_KLT22307 [Carex littledalei]
MEKNKKIVEVRERLDKTLASPDLVNINSIRSLVKSQLRRSGLEGDIDLIVDKRTKEVSNCLDMLRSASGHDESVLKQHGTASNDWKLKQDTDQYRVLYREGLHGTPFHTLLLDGFVDGPIDACKLISILSFSRWPQYNFPTFKIITSDVLKKVRIGEQIALIRVKVPWPVSEREALVNFFVFEYLKEDLVLVLINTISDEEEVGISTHGFTREGIPKADGTIRLDMVGGFVFQKVNEEKSYIRAIYNVDIKLDFVPASMINFVSRQLVASGHKLFQKAISTVASSDKDYQKALKGPLYARIRHSMKKPTASGVTLSTNERVQQNSPTTNGTSVTEIEEEWYEAMDGIPESPETSNRQEMMDTSAACVSPDVAHALSILDGAIAKVRQNRSSGKNEVAKAFQRKLVRFSSDSKTGPSGNGNGDLDMDGADMVNGSLLNGWRYEGPSARDSRIGAMPSSLHREKNGKVSDEGTLKKANGFNAEGPTTIKKRKSKKWQCCIGRSGASQ